jgi:hypothetical protein
VDPSKIRIRTPLFWVHIICAFALFFALGIALDLGDRSEPYDRDPAVQQFWMTLSVALAGISIPVGLAAAALEVAVLRGYDPKFLARQMYGVTLAEITRPATMDPHIILHVSHRDGRIHDYLAEPDEARGLKPGDVLRLDVFGKHVVGLRRLESLPPTQRDHALGKWWKRNRRTFSPLMNAPFMVLAYPIAGFVTGANLLSAIFQQDMVRVGRRWRSRHFLLIGTEALVPNLLLIGAAWIVLIGITVYWLRGWNEESLGVARDDQ